MAFIYLGICHASFCLLSSSEDWWWWRPCPCSWWSILPRGRRIGWPCQRSTTLNFEDWSISISASVVRLLFLSHAPKVGGSFPDPPSCWWEPLCWPRWLLPWLDYSMYLWWYDSSYFRLKKHYWLTSPSLYSGFNDYPNDGDSDFAGCGWYYALFAWVWTAVFFLLKDPVKFAFYRCVDLFVRGM